MFAQCLIAGHRVNIVCMAVEFAHTFAILVPESEYSIVAAREKRIGGQWNEATYAICVALEQAQFLALGVPVVYTLVGTACDILLLGGCGGHGPDSRLVTLQRNECDIARFADDPHACRLIPAAANEAARLEACGQGTNGRLMTLQRDQRHKCFVLIDANGCIIASRADPLLGLQVTDVGYEVLVVLQCDTLQVLVAAIAIL